MLYSVPSTPWQHVTSCLGNLALDTDLSTENPANTAVQIFGATYHVRGNDDREYLQELADFVDGKMREVAQHVTTADPARIAILAALNMADELFRTQKRQEGERVEIKEKVAELAEELREALGG